MALKTSIFTILEKCKKSVTQRCVSEPQIVSGECQMSNVKVILKLLHVMLLWRLWHQKDFHSTNVLLLVVSAGHIVQVT